MDQLRAMRVFAGVIDAGSFNGAASALRLSPAAVTRLVAELEDHLGARLINRTTRRLALTEIGEAYLDKVRRILADIEESEALTSSAVQEPRGHLRVLTSPAFAVHQLAPKLSAFYEKHPHVTVEIVAPGAVESVDENFDVSILTVRKPLEGEFVARRLARTEVIACAAPEYLTRHGRPRHPSELVDHHPILPPFAELQRGVEFFRGPWGDDEPGGETYRTPPRPHALLSTSHIDTMFAAARAGIGIAGLPSFVIAEALRTHTLERVLPEWHLWSATLWAAMPSRKHIPTRTRAFVDFLIGFCGGADHDPWLQAAGCETPACAGAPQKV